MAEGYNSLSDLLAAQHEPFFLSDSIALNSTEDPDVDGGNPTGLNVIVGEELQRSRLLSSLSRQSASMTPPIVPAPMNFDFRALEYLPDYDPRLMCPICHVPLLDPIRLPCDHMFCSACYEAYRSSASRLGQSSCPTCRAKSLGNNFYARKDVPRMIINMCNEIKAHCPFSGHGCQKILPRELIAHHAGHCDFEPIECPLETCTKLTRKRDLEWTRCRHGLVTCRGCGTEVMDQDLSYHSTDCSASKCSYCGSRQLPEGVTLAAHEAMCLQAPRKCSGESFGCKIALKEEELTAHEESCLFVVLAPHLKLSASKTETLEADLTVQKDRNERLEATCKRLWDIMKIHIVPTIDEMRRSTNPGQTVSQPPTQVPQSSSTSHYPLTPNPASANNPSSQFLFHNPLTLASHPSPSPYSPSSTSPDPLTHLLSLHESLRTDASSMNNRIDGVTSSLDNFIATYTESESRANMMLLNDMLRMKEDLAHMNAAVFRMRAQVGWLRRMNGIGVGLGGAGPGRQLAEGGQNVQSPTTTTTDAHAQSGNDSPGAGSSGPSVSGAVRPPGAAEHGRRPSDGHSSQERVKL